MSRLAPTRRATRSPRGRRTRPVVYAVGALALTLAAGCTSLQLPPPDAPAARLPQTPGTPAMTEAQKQDLTRLNKRIYDEQEATIERDRAQRAIDEVLRSNAYGYGGWGGVGWYGPGWYGPRWYGPGGYGGYGPGASVGVGIGF